MDYLHGKNTKKQPYIYLIYHLFVDFALPPRPRAYNSIIFTDRFTSIDDIYRTLNYLYIYQQKSGIILKKKRDRRK